MQVRFLRLFGKIDFRKPFSNNLRFLKKMEDELHKTHDYVRGSISNAGIVHNILNNRGEGWNNQQLIAVDGDCILPFLN